MQSRADFEVFFEALLNGDKFKEGPEGLLLYLRKLEKNLTEQERILHDLTRLESELQIAGVSLNQTQQERGEVSVNEIKHLRVVLFRRQVQEKLLKLEFDGLEKSILHPLDLKKPEDFLRQLTINDIEFLWKNEKR